MEMLWRDVSGETLMLFGGAVDTPDQPCYRAYNA